MKTNNLQMRNQRRRSAVQLLHSQLCSYCTVDQHLCFRYTCSTTLLLRKSEISSCDYAGRFVSDLVGNPNCWFSHAQAQIINCILGHLTSEIKMYIHINIQVHGMHVCMCTSNTGILFGHQIWKIRLAPVVIVFCFFYYKFYLNKKSFSSSVPL